MGPECNVSQPESLIAGASFETPSLATFLFPLLQSFPPQHTQAGVFNFVSQLNQHPSMNNNGKAVQFHYQYIHIR